LLLEAVVDNPTENVTGIKTGIGISLSQRDEQLDGTGIPSSRFEVDLVKLTTF
jgi:hypothetical protein